MIFLKKTFFILSLLHVISSTSAQSIDTALKTDPLLELGVNTKILGLKGNVKEMQEHKFEIDYQGHTTNDSASVSNLYKFDLNGLTKEIEETIRDSQTKKSFFSYTNKGYISHIDIETTLLSSDNDSTYTKSDMLIFTTVDYKYVQKKNILFKGEDYIVSIPKKTTTRKDYFYHFNDDNQIFQTDSQTTELVIKYNYDINGLIKESLTLKSGVPSHKNIYKYDRNNRPINIVTFNSDNTSKYPNNETIITYKLDSNGNISEKKIKTYAYTSKGSKDFKEGFLYFYNYIYL